MVHFLLAMYLASRSTNLEWLKRLPTPRAKSFDPSGQLKRYSSKIVYLQCSSCWTLGTWIAGATVSSVRDFRRRVANRPRPLVGLSRTSQLCSGDESMATRSTCSTEALIALPSKSTNEARGASYRIHFGVIKWSQEASYTHFVAESTKNTTAK